MIQVNRIYLIFNRLVTKKFLVDTSDSQTKLNIFCKVINFSFHPLSLKKVIFQPHTEKIQHLQ